MELSVLERLIVIGVLPVQGDYATLKILNQLKMGLSFSEKEIADWGIAADIESNQTRWAENGMAEIPIGEKATEIIVAAFKKLNADQMLLADAMSAYEKFIPSDV